MVGGSKQGDVYGMYRLADDLLASGRGYAVRLSRTTLLSHERAAGGPEAVGIPQDPARWDPANYSHHLRAFEDVFLAEAPYVDREKFANGQRRSSPTCSA
ncbi:MAG: hypothetical protein R2844_20375 [Caldilineales bacterium]